MHCHSHGDFGCVLGAVTAETDLNAGDSVSFLLQVELNQAVVDWARSKECGSEDMCYL